MFGHSHSHGHGHGHSHKHFFSLQDDEDANHHQLKKTQALKHLTQLAAPEKYLLIISISALLVSAGVNLLVPWALGYIVSSSSREEVNKIVLFLIPVFIGGVCCTVIRGFLFAYAGERLIKRLRAQLFSAITTQDIGFFDQNKTGELINRLSVDTNLIQSAATVTTAMIIRFSIQIVGGSALLMVISWKLTFVMLIPIPIGAFFAYFFGRWMKYLSHKVQDALASNTAVAEESITHIRLVRSFANEAVEAARYAQHILVSFELGKRMCKALATVQGGAELATYTTILLVAWYGATLMIDDQLDDATLTSFLLYALTVAHALGALSNHLGDMVRSLGASERVFDILERIPAMNTLGGTKPATVQGLVEYSHVIFAYPSRSDQQVLQDFSLVLQPGRVVGVVGGSGSGKTTLTQLLLRLYDVNEGKVMVDGVDVRDLDPLWLRQNIGYVGQDPVLFNMSIRESIHLVSSYMFLFDVITYILYGKPNASVVELHNAAKAAHIHDFIMSLTEGYDTECGEKGVRMSGGQKQRITIARALIKEPKILVFDEATSALDSENERLVQQTMEQVSAGRTVLLIAHRISTVKQAHTIIAMEGGKLVECGTHAELLEKGGVYSKLVATQMQNDL